MADFAALAQLQAAAALAQFSGMGALGLPGAVPAVRSATPTGAELPANTPMPGTVKAWMEDKGYGFVSPLQGGPDIFVHRNQLTDGQSLVTGTPVTLECRYNPARSKYEATSCSGASATGAVVKPPEGEAGAAAASGGDSTGQDNLFVAGFPLGTSEEQVRQLFAQYGSVSQCKVLPDQPGKNDRAALVRFADRAQAKWMVENMNGNIPVGMTVPLRVTYAGANNSGVKAAAPQPTFGKAAVPALDNRFSPYGAVPGLEALANPALAQMAALQAAALGGAVPQLDQAGLATALQQLVAQQQMAALPGLAGLGGLPGLPGLPGMSMPGLGLAGLPGMVGAGLPALDQGALAALAGVAAPATAVPGAAEGGAAIAGTAPAGDAATAATAPADASAVVGAAATAPAAVTSAAPAPAPAPAPAQEGEWMEAKDPNSGKPYYYHSVTRETRWEKPAQ